MHLSPATMLCSPVCMRVIAGIYRGRPLQAPRGTATRPTSDRLRETLFNVLAPRIEGARVADLFAGTGAVGIEALSRGAAHVTFVESAAPAVAALRQNLTKFGIDTAFQLDQRNVPASLRLLSKRNPQFTLVYLDPPWEETTAYTQTMTLLGQPASTLLATDALVIAEHARRMPHALTEAYGTLERYRVLEQGDAALSFYRRQSGQLESH